MRLFDVRLERDDGLHHRTQHAPRTRTALLKQHTHTHTHTYIYIYIYI
jgi:hypothetical protein